MSTNNTASADDLLSQSVNTSISRLRTFLLVSGIVALLAGLAILIWPVRTVVITTVLLAIYALIAGIVSLALGIFAKMSGWARVGNILLGLLFIVASIMAFMNPGEAAGSLAIIVAIFIGASWLVDGIVSLVMLGDSPSKGWTVAYAIISILGGIAVMWSPLFAAAWLWLFFGAVLVVMGIVQIARAFTLHKVK